MTIEKNEAPQSSRIWNPKGILTKENTQSFFHINMEMKYQSNLSTESFWLPMRQSSVQVTQDTEWGFLNRFFFIFFIDKYKFKLWIYATFCFWQLFGSTCYESSLLFYKELHG